MLDYVDDLVDGQGDAKVAFVARHLVADDVREGTRLLVMEGRRPVADVVITEVFGERLGRG